MALREQLLSETFVALADTLVDDFDVVEFLSFLCERCVELFDAEAAGVMLASAPGGTLQLMASSCERMRLIELFELQGDEGPCPDCYRSGMTVGEADLATAGGRWPSFSGEALRAGFRAVYAVPMRLHGEVFGAVNLFRDRGGGLSEADLGTAQALADVATIGILQQRSQGELRSLSKQLQYALERRIIIEQAKGVLAERCGIGVDEAFSVLRRYARDHNRHLSEVAQDVTDWTLQASALVKRTGRAAHPEA